MQETEIRPSCEEIMNYVECTFEKLKSIKSGTGFFLSLSVYKAALISSLVKSLSGGALNVIKY